MDSTHSLTVRAPDARRAALDPVAQFHDAIFAIAALHHPSRMPFFNRLKQLPPAACNSRLLGNIYLVYQSAMHATRAAVYHMPHLDAPALRKRKLQIFIDDDGLPGGDTHHYQLARAFRNMGADCALGDEDFGDADELSRHLDAKTARFVRLAKRLYAHSLGPWCIVEVLSDDWMKALATALAVHHPPILREPYFADCFAQGVEERHAEEAIAVTEEILRRRPELVAETLKDAKQMAVALDGVWRRLDEIVREAAGARKRG